VRYRWARRLEEERAQALVEFALVLPVVALLLFAVLQFGIVFNNYITLTDAVRAGARTAAVSRQQPDPTAAGTDAVRRTAANLEATRLAVSVTAASWQRGEDVTVSATYPYEVNLLGLVVKRGRLESRNTERIE